MRQQTEGRKDKMIKFNVSGQSMTIMEGSEITINPVHYDGGSQGARDAFEALKHPDRKRVGRGITYVVETTRAGAETIKDYCETVGESFIGGADDPEVRADGRALLRTAKIIERELAK
jgi:hypothetical protein